MRRRTDRLPDDGEASRKARGRKGRPAPVIDFVIRNRGRPAGAGGRATRLLILIYTKAERNSGSRPVTEARRVGS
jgi:hypothetical protein